MKLTTEQDFINQVGKRIYRDYNKCDCPNCTHILEHGLIVIDDLHASYLAETASDFMAEGLDCNYRTEL